MSCYNGFLIYFDVLNNITSLHMTYFIFCKVNRAFFLISGKKNLSALHLFSFDSFIISLLS